MIPKLSTDAIELSVTANVPVTITHSIGRQLSGWLVIWQDAAVNFVVQDADADTSRQLVLVPSATANVRIVLL